MTSPLSLLVEPGDHAIPISAIASDRLDPWLAAQTAPVRHWLTVTGFKGELGATAVMSDPHGEIARVAVGDDLLAANYPMIHAVGRASASPPRLIDFTWGPSSAAKVTLVGKGVCFDTGGLDLKPSSAMALMKKDMGGAAVVLGLAQMIMASNLPVRLRVLIPAVENAVSGNAFHPGDVL